MATGCGPVVCQCPITGVGREVGGVSGGFRRRPLYWLSRVDNTTAGEGRAAASLIVLRAGKDGVSA